MVDSSCTVYWYWCACCSQYTGFTPCFSPPYVIALLGLVPITTGVIRLSHLRNNNYKSDEIKMPVSKWHNHFSILMVAGVTFSNGGDNIGIYIPLFAKYNSSFEVMYIFTIFMIMTAVW